MDTTSTVHALSPQSKILATVGFVLVVVLTPREWIFAFAGYLIVLIVALRMAVDLFIRPEEIYTVQ